MHEFALGQWLVEAVVAELDRLDSAAPHRLLKVVVKVGRLRQIVPENFMFAFQQWSQKTPAEGAELVLHFQPITARCEACGWEGELTAASFLCPECGSGRVQVTRGMELVLEQLEIESDDAAND
jgi:hydrogenase nickel incorporation protein HypA/HybF